MRPRGAGNAGIRERKPPRGENNATSGDGYSTTGEHIASQRDGKASREEPNLSRVDRHPFCEERKSFHRALQQRRSGRPSRRSGYLFFSWC
jgi:hypothetical protein